MKSYEVVNYFIADVEDSLTAREVRYRTLLKERALAELANLASRHGVEFDYENQDYFDAPAAKGLAEDWYVIEEVEIDE